MRGDLLDMFHSTLPVGISFVTALGLRHAHTEQAVSANCGNSFIISAIIYNSILALYYKNK